MLASTTEAITLFYNHPFFIIAGGVGVTLLLVTFFLKVIFTIVGITPVLSRLGFALWNRDVAIFATSDTYSSLKKSLKDSGLFREKNIECINLDNIDKAKGKTCFIVEYSVFKDKLQEVFSARQDHRTPVIIYAQPGTIPNDVMADVANKTNVIVVNFRGRLVNDVLVSLITTSYDTK